MGKSKECVIDFTQLEEMRSGPQFTTLALAQTLKV